MNLLHHAVSAQLALLGWAILLPSVWLSWRQVRTRFFRSGLVEHAWWGGAMCLAVLWLMVIKVGNGPAFGMLGVALYALVFGRSRAMLGLTLAVIVHTALRHGAWGNVGLNGLLFAVVPSLLAAACQRWIEHHLPKHLFVFIFGNGMFVSLVVTSVTATLLFLVSTATDPSWSRIDVGQYLGPLLLLAWSEAIVSGMLLSALVIFAPEVVLTYSQDRYLPRKSLWPR